MSARLMIREVEPGPVPDHPELRAAYAAERAALQRVVDLKTRKAALEVQVRRLRRDQEHAAARMARGENVTGADIRRGAEAITDCEAEMAVIETALPKAGNAVYDAASDRSAAERSIYEAAYQPYRLAAAAAKQALEAAQAAYDRAKSEAVDLPANAAAALDDTLDSHGRDRSAPGIVTEMRRVQQVNESRRVSGQGPQLVWP